MTADLHVRVSWRSEHTRKMVAAKNQEPFFPTVSKNKNCVARAMGNRSFYLEWLYNNPTFLYLVFSAKSEGKSQISIIVIFLVSWTSPRLKILVTSYHYKVVASALTVLKKIGGLVEISKPYSRKPWLKRSLNECLCYLTWYVDKWWAPQHSVSRRNQA